MPNIFHSKSSVVNLVHMSSIRINLTTRAYIIGQEVISKTSVAPKTRPHGIQMQRVLTVVKPGSVGICGSLPPGTPWLTWTMKSILVFYENEA